MSVFTDQVAPGDDYYMLEALREARRCLEREPADVPVGALCVDGNGIVSRGHNRRELDNDPTAHAEVLALRAAAASLGNWRLTGITLYITLEPCAMCAGAILLARVDRVVFGAPDPRAGAGGSLYDVLRDPRQNHHPQVKTGVQADACADLLTSFFSTRRTATQ